MNTLPLGLNTGGLPEQGIGNGLPELPVFPEQAFAYDLPEPPVGLPESSEVVDPANLRSYSCCELIEFQRGDGTRSQPYKLDPTTFWSSRHSLARNVNRVWTYQGRQGRAELGVYDFLVTYKSGYRNYYTYRANSGNGQFQTEGYGGWIIGAYCPYFNGVSGDGWKSIHFDHTGGKITRDSGAKINCITEEQALPESHDYTENCPKAIEYNSPGTENYIFVKTDRVINNHGVYESQEGEWCMFFVSRIAMSYWEFQPCSKMNREINGFETISNIDLPANRRGWVPLPSKIEDHCPTNPDIFWVAAYESIYDPSYRGVTVTEKILEYNPCPGGSCWTFNKTMNACEMVPSCSRLLCYSTYMLIEMDPELFGLDDADSAMWASKAQPFLADNGQLVYIERLGAEGMSVHLAEDEDKFAAKVWFAIKGSDRQRSDLMATETDLGGDLKVYSANVGIQVTYTCEYSSKVTLDTQAFDVQTVTAFGTNSGRGNLAAGFGFSLSSMTEDDNRFIMGGMLEVGVQWNVDFLDDITFTIDDCTVNHGDVSISVLKDGCYAGLLDSNSIETTDDHSKAFSFKIFKGTETESGTQDITCEVSLCKNHCKIPTDQAQCPSDEVMNYRIAGAPAGEE